ncbi:MAG TPA: N-acetyl sugar amidotransferase [Ignavibacteria bacterium]|nr:N-acetyl sugar amidotransferase [Ignavibacteria bacterium]
MRICSRCMMDETVSEIIFDENGVCQYCKMHDRLNELYPLNEEGKKAFEKLIADVKESGKGKKYDCIMGVSGGTDSTFALYNAVKLGLRPLAVHLDNGWDSEIAVQNIKNACKKLNVDLYTHVLDWEEFKNIQISFLKASTPDAEVPTDVAIMSVLIRVAGDEGVKYVLNGHSFRTEGISPLSWSCIDGKYIENVQKQFGKVKMKTFPNFLAKDLLYYTFVKGVKVVPFLNYYDYVKPKVKPFLTEELGWIDYGAHHHETYYTIFYHAFLLPQKFGIDKRKTEYSAMIREGLLTRDEAMADFKNNPTEYDKRVVDYTIDKLGLTKDEFEKIYNYPVKSFKDYKTYFSTLQTFKKPIRMLVNMGLFPELLYMKYIGKD